VTSESVTTARAKGVAGGISGGSVNSRGLDQRRVKAVEAVKFPLPTSTRCGRICSNRSEWVSGTPATRDRGCVAVASKKRSQRGRGDERCATMDDLPHLDGDLSVYYIVRFAPLGRRFELVLGVGFCAAWTRVGVVQQSAFCAAWTEGRSVYFKCVTPTNCYEALGGGIAGKGNCGSLEELEERPKKSALNCYIRPFTRSIDTSDAWRDRPSRGWFA
jgi:hypothetical protein